MLNVLVIYVIFQILLKLYIGEGKRDTHTMKEKKNNNSVTLILPLKEGRTKVEIIYTVTSPK